MQAKKDIGEDGSRMRGQVCNLYFLMAGGRRKEGAGIAGMRAASGAVEKAIENGLVRESLYETKISSMFACVFKHAQSKFVRATRKFVTFSTAPQSPFFAIGVRNRRSRP